MESMTGFGSGSGVVGGVGVRVEASAVNRKGLEVVVSVPKEWQGLEAGVVECVRARFERGKFHFYVLAQNRSSSGEGLWDAVALEQGLNELKGFCNKQGLILGEADGRLVLELAR